MSVKKIAFNIGAGKNLKGIDDGYSTLVSVCVCARHSVCMGIDQGHIMKNIFILFMALWMLASSIDEVRAQALPVTVTQNATAGIMRQFLLKRGFAANDPRFASTFSAMSSTFAGYAAGAVAIVGAAVTAPAWLTVAVAALGVPLALWAGDQAARWLWDKNNPTKVTLSAPGTVPVTPPMTVGGNSWYVNIGGKVVVEGSDPQGVAAQYGNSLGNGFRMGNCYQQSSAQWYCGLWKYDAVTDKWDYNAGSYNVNLNTNAQHACDAGMYWDSTGCHALSPQYPATNNTPQPINTAVASIPGLDAAKPLNPQVLTNAINQAWKDMSAKPGYTGVPYDNANPITVADVETWANTHPDVWPKVSDWTKPQDPAVKPWTIPNTTAPVTSYDPGTAPSTGSNPAGASQPQMNLGNDPGIGAPSLEDTPTAEMILRPILNLMPDLKNYTAPAISGECPKPQFQLFESTYAIDAHCDVLEQNKGVIRISMLLAFTIASLFIVLRA